MLNFQPYKAHAQVGRKLEEGLLEEAASQLFEKIDMQERLSPMPQPTTHLTLIEAP